MGKKERVRHRPSSGEWLFLLLLTSGSRTHNVRIEWLHIDVSDGAAGQRPHLGFVLESSSDLPRQAKPRQIMVTNDTEGTDTSLPLHLHLLYIQQILRSKVSYNT